MKEFLKSDDVSFLTLYDMSHMSYDVIADFLEFFNYGGRHPSIR